MADHVLTQIDEAIARAAGTPRRGRGVPHEPVTVQLLVEDETEAETPEKLHLIDHPIWPQLFLAIQFLWGMALFLPGAQGFRFAVRALPYVSALAFLVMFELNRSKRGPLPTGAGWLLAALLLLVLNLFHPTSQPYAGIAQCIFQLSIAAPIFWMHKAVRSPRQLEKLLALVLVMNFVSAGLGVLQVYYPDRFMPPQLNYQLGDNMLEALSYVGADGRIIVRPPGLSDTPGGAALAGGLTALLGLGFALHTRKLWQTTAVTVMSGVGLAAVYLTQVRSVLLMTIGAIALIGVLALRQGRVMRASLGLAIAGALVVGSFMWASSVGGASVESRFLNIRDQGAMATFRANRGDFLSSTLGELLDKYPLGAGVGRWGMMHQYFGDPFMPGAESIWVEIQPTGWLLDGGVPMWILYGGAIVLSLISVLGFAFSPNPAVAELAPIVFAIQLFIAGMSLSGPSFNTQIGIIFWAVGAALFGAARGAAAEPHP